MIANAVGTYTSITIWDVLRKAQEGKPVQKLILEGDIVLASVKAGMVLLIQLLPRSSKIKSISCSQNVFKSENMISDIKHEFQQTGRSQFTNDKY
jgi:hypothetical protein